MASADGAIALEQQIPTLSQQGPEAVLKRIADLVLAMSRQLSCPPKALGMGVPGLADIKHGITRFLPNLPTQWRDVPVAKLLGQQIGCPVFLLNDVRTATLGELTFGHGRSPAVQTMAFFALGTGIGGGIAIDGRLRLGPVGAAGELGHQTVLPDGPLCGCGNRGCLETLASGPALTAEGIRLLKSGLAPRLFDLVEGDVGRLTTREMAMAAEQGDEAVGEAIRRACQFLAIGIANVITALHPELVVVGGGVAEMGDVLLTPLKEAVVSRVRMLPVDTVQVLPSKLRDKAGVLGAVALASNPIAS
jgi:glucokinase